MQARLSSMVDWLRRYYWHQQGERMLLTTFWPQDYPRGAVYPANFPTYRITRYVHAADHRFFEVWGQPLPDANPDRSTPRPVPASNIAMAQDNV